MINKAIFNRAPLAQNELAALPLGAIRPQGWLKHQLETAAQGLTGKLYEFWPSVSESAWCGGEGDNWERAPYYLDGLVPLAWEMGDEELKSVCMRYIEWTLQSQREDGFFGPADNEDWWPRMVMLKVMIQYYTATGDQRVPGFMFNYFKYQYRMLEEKPLEGWAVVRGAENIETVVWLYNLTGAKFLLSLMKRLKEQTIDWTGHFHAFPYTRSMKEIIPWEDMKSGLAKESTPLSGRDRPYYATQYHLSHVVNTAMGLRAGAIMSQFTDSARDRSAFRVGYEKLMRSHGVATGMFNGDEHLSGNSPTQGTELCAVVEMMYTCELLPTTGADWTYAGDVLERIAFNALPAAMTADMMAHQYDQQVNQVRATNEKHGWYNNADNSNTFGLEPNYGCCTANMHQGWPKLVSSLWYATRDEGFYCMSYAPCTVTFFSGSVPVRIDVETRYPFERSLTIRVSPETPKTFPIRLRVPSWAGYAGVICNNEAIENAQQDNMIELMREWKRGDEITLIFPLDIRMTRWSRRSASVEYGPLLMAYRPVENCVKTNNHSCAPDYSITTRDTWNRALVAGHEMYGTATEREVGFGFADTPNVYADMVTLPEWGMKGADCAPTPVEPTLEGAASVERIRLVPYGDTCLRVAQFPLATLKVDSTAGHGEGVLPYEVPGTSATAWLGREGAQPCDGPTSYYIKKME